MTQRSGEITSPWSIPICTLYGAVLPNAVMMELNLFEKRSAVRLMNLFGILSRAMATLSILVSIESKALEMSCWKINSGLLRVRASWRMASNADIGGSQEPPGRPAKLPPLRTLNLTNKEERRLYMILVRSFLAVSKRVIGRVFFR